MDITVAYALNNQDLLRGYLERIMAERGLSHLQLAYDLEMAPVTLTKFMKKGTDMRQAQVRKILKFIAPYADLFVLK